MQTIFLFLIFLPLSQCQIIDVYGIYNNYSYYGIIYQKSSICYCPINNCTIIQPSPKINISNLLSIGKLYSFNNKTISFKINLTICDPININTDYFNYIQYSYDGITWSNKDYGFSYLCSKIGIIYINITSTILESIRFDITQVNRCNYTKDSVADNYLINLVTNSTETIFNFYIKGYSYSTYVTSDNCELDNYLYYESTYSLLKYNYSIGSSFAWSNNYLDTYNLSYYIKTNESKNCSILIYISSNIVNSIYTSNILFYNGSQVLDYLKIGNVYNLSSVEVTLDGGISTVSYNSSHKYLIKSMNNSEVFKNIKYFEPNPDDYDFSPLLKYYNIYINTSLIIDLNTIFISNYLVINNSFANINLTLIPIYLNIINSSTLFINEKVDVKGLSFSGNNTFNLIKTLTVNVNGSANFSGNLTINSQNILITYFNHTGEFDNVVLNNKTLCKSQIIYTQSQLMILTRDECTDNTNTNTNTILYIVIPIILVIIIIIIAVVLLKVKLFRKKLFPHRDRTFFKPTLLPSSTINI